MKSHCIVLTATVLLLLAVALPAAYSQQDAVTPEEEWSRMTPEQRENLRERYQQRGKGQGKGQGQGQGQGQGRDN